MMDANLWARWNWAMAKIDGASNAHVTAVQSVIEDAKMATNNGDVVFLCRQISQSTNFGIEDVMLSALVKAEKYDRPVEDVLEEWRQMGFRANSEITVKTGGARRKR